MLSGGATLMVRVAGRSQMQRQATSYHRDKLRSLGGDEGELQGQHPEFCINTDELWITNDELCIYNHASPQMLNINIVYNTIYYAATPNVSLD